MFMVPRKKNSSIVSFVRNHLLRNGGWRTMWKFFILIEDNLWMTIEIHTFGIQSNKWHFQYFLSKMLFLNRHLLVVVRLTEKPKNRTEKSKTEPNRNRNSRNLAKPNRTENRNWKPRLTEKPSERVFSSAGTILTKKWSRPGHKRTQQILYAYLWIRHF